MEARITKAYNLVFNEKTGGYFQKISIGFAVIGFIFHLILIYLNINGWVHFSRGNELLQRPIQALYTPFSIVLFEEVYILLGFLTFSFSKSIITQFEILSLFILRGIFKDISFIDLSKPGQSAPEILNLFFSLGSLVVLIFLVALIRKTIRLQESGIKDGALNRFVLIKKALVLFYVIILSVLAFWDLFFWARDQFLHDPNPIRSVSEINSVFYKDFFTLMIFFDVLILLISLRYTQSYDLLLRNSGFILSTVILRISMTSPVPYGSLGFVLSAGLCLFFVFIYNRFQGEGNLL